MKMTGQAEAAAIFGADLVNEPGNAIVIGLGSSGKEEKGKKNRGNFAGDDFTHVFTLILIQHNSQYLGDVAMI